MKETDLMIGDWVIEKDRVCRVSFNTIIEEVRKEDCATSASSSTRYYDIEPVPLTPEILDKNGWSYDDLVQEYYGEMRIMGSQAPYSIRDGIEITYVHELQHALKLCGIDKQITL